MYIKFTKIGQIFNISEDWGPNAGFSHCHKPTPFLVNDTTIRVYFGIRDFSNRTKVSFVDLDANDFHVKYVNKGVILDVGKLGTFDDAGAQVCSVVRINPHTIYMYYIGWNTSTTVPSRNSLGLAISTDDGLTFNRMYEGPVVERNKNEPYYVGASDVLLEGDIWKLWYDSGDGYERINDSIEYKVNIKYAESSNGIDWVRKNLVCLASKKDEAVVRPSVIKFQGKYRMFYSYRKLKDFRSDKKSSYRFGYAESLDGINWLRRDDVIDFEPSAIDTDWDSVMVAYPYALECHNQLLLFYNGNGFGKTGFGLAKIRIED